MKIGDKIKLDDEGVIRTYTVSKPGMRHPSERLKENEVYLTSPGVMGFDASIDWVKQNMIHDKMEKGGVIGQEIVFDDNGETNTGVIKDIHEITGNYIITTDDGRTVLADKELDVISLGKMRKQEAKKRFSFFEDGGKVSTEKGYKVGDILKHETFTGEFPVPSYEVIAVLGPDSGASFSSRPRSILRVKNLKTGEVSEINEGRFSKYKMEDGGNLDSMSLNQLLDKVPVFERMHIEGYSNYIRNKEAFDDLVKKLGDKRYSEEESRQYDNFYKRKRMYENSYKENVIKYLKSKKMEDGGNIEKENNEMLHSQAKEAKHHIEELHNILTSKTKVEPWVVAKMTRAKTDLSDITHYLDGNTSKMAKGGKLTDAQQEKFDKVMHEWKQGTLHSGSANGPIVKDQNQAIAIAYSEAYGMDKMLFGGMVNELSDDTIDRMEGLVPISTLQELLDNAKFIIADMYEEGFEKDEIMSFLAYKISQIGSGNTMQSVSQVQQWTEEDEDALDEWISDIQDGYGWITPGYVESSWTSRPGSGTKEWNSDIQERVYQRLIDENMLFAENPNDYEKKGKKIKDVTTAIWTASEENGYEHGGKMETGGAIEKFVVGEKYFYIDKENRVTVVVQIKSIDKANNMLEVIALTNSKNGIYFKGSRFFIAKKDLDNVKEYVQLETGGGVDDWVYWKIEKKVNGDDIVIYERTHASSPIIPNATEISKREYDENKYSNGGGVGAKEEKMIASKAKAIFRDLKRDGYDNFDLAMMTEEEVKETVDQFSDVPDNLKNQVADHLYMICQNLNFEHGGSMYAKGGNIKKGDIYEWHTVEYDSKKGNNYKVVKQVEITDIHNGDVIGRVVGTSNEFIIREPNKYLKKKVSSKMATGGGVRKAPFKVGDMVYSYQNPNHKMRVSFVEDRGVIDGVDYGWGIKVALKTDSEGNYDPKGTYSKSSKWMSHNSVSKVKKEKYDKGGKMTGWKHKSK